MAEWGTIIGTIVGFATLNFLALHWLIDRHDTLRQDNSEKINGLERELLTLKADLPREYVMREDWIRFSNTLEAKMDAMRAEMRNEMSQLATQLGERFDARGN